MATLTIDELVETAQSLGPGERRLLIEHLEDGLRKKRLSRERLRWEDAAGIAKYPVCGENAQAWVSRTRAESDCTRCVARSARVQKEWRPCQR